MDSLRPPGRFKGCLSSLAVAYEENIQGLRAYGSIEHCCRDAVHACAKPGSLARMPSCLRPVPASQLRRLPGSSACAAAVAWSKDAVAREPCQQVHTRVHEAAADEKTSPRLERALATAPRVAGRSRHPCLQRSERGWQSAILLHRFHQGVQQGTDAGLCGLAYCTKEQCHLDVPGSQAISKSVVQSCKRDAAASF